jgi:Na+/H+-dicarboxylate symporter
MIPHNPVQSFLDANVLQVIFLAIIAGIALMNISVKKDALIEIIDTSNAMVTYLIALIMEIMPIGIFSLLAFSASTFGGELILKLIELILIMVIVSIIQVFVVYSILLKIYHINVISFFKNIFEAMLIAFSTSSSTATLPTSILCAKKENIQESVYSFVLPLGATINMNGSAIYQAISAVFIAQIIGFDLSFYHYFAIVITTLLASIGTAGVPGAGLLMLTLVLTVVGLPVEGIAIIAGVDRILDMIRTSVNITGDLVVAKILSNKI